MSEARSVPSNQSRDTARAYHSIRACYGLDDLRRQRLKIAQLDELNDPFELLATAQSCSALRGTNRWPMALSLRSIRALFVGQRWTSMALGVKGGPACYRNYVSLLIRVLPEEPLFSLTYKSSQAELHRISPYLERKVESVALGSAPKQRSSKDELSQFLHRCLGISLSTPELGFRLKRSPAPTSVARQTPQPSFTGVGRITARPLMSRAVMGGKAMMEAPCCGCSRRPGSTARGRGRGGVLVQVGHYFAIELAGDGVEIEGDQA